MRLIIIFTITLILVNGIVYAESETGGLDVKISTKPLEKADEAKIGSAEKNISRAAKLAADFMAAQADAENYSPVAVGVMQEKNGTYIATFSCLDGSMKNSAQVEVFLAENRCSRKQEK